VKILIRIVAVLVVVVLVLGAFVYSQFQLPANLEPTATEFTLTGVNVVTPARQRLNAVNLAVRDGKIGFVGKADSEDREQPEPTFDGFAGHTVLPGIINMHTHLPPDTALGLTAYFGLLQIAHGVTTVREAGDMDGSSIAAAKRVFDVEGRPGPRVAYCGPFVGGENPRWKNSVVVTSPEQAPAVVAELAASGSRCIKLYDDLDVPRIRALVAEAKKHGIKAIGHVPYGLTIEEALIPDTQHLMGVAHPEDIERGDHVVFRVLDWRAVTPERMAEVVEVTGAHGLVHTPTLVATHQLRHYADVAEDPGISLLPRFFRDVVWSPTEGIPMYRSLTADDHAMIRDSREKKMRMIKLLSDSGAVLHIGTDTQQPFVVPGVAAQTEMRLFAEAGIPLPIVWANATWRAGESLGVANRLGYIVAGAPADLLVFREDPTRSVDAFNTLEAVVVGGRLYLREDLDTAIARYREHYAGAVVDAVSVAVARRIIASSARRDH
jgi:cytosine/adenosine deaminase-related metal-dependent hydrolase